VSVVEVDRPNRQNRRRRGKSDVVDAVAAARAAQSGDASGKAKTRNGNVEAMRVLRLVKLSARRSKTVALNQMRSIVATGPEELRGPMRDLSAPKLITRAAALRPAGRTDVLGANKVALRLLARRAQAMDAEIAEINALLEPLVVETAPDLLTADGVGTDVAPPCWWLWATTPSACDRSGPSLISAASHRSTRRRASRSAIASAGPVTARPTPRCGGW
jgi:hypothetical protein